MSASETFIGTYQLITPCTLACKRGRVIGVSVRMCMCLCLPPIFSVLYSDSIVIHFVKNVNAITLIIMIPIMYVYHR